jgi:AcrR family transcriptional regulator
MRESQKVAASDSATPSRQQRRTEKTRERLLDAALEVFLERGYDGASPGLVTERADLGTGTFYLHFRDKRAVYEAVVRRRLVALRLRWSEEREKQAPGGGPPEEISLMIRMVVDALLADAPYARLILFDGPPLESWLVDEIGRGVAEVIGSRVPDAGLIAHLVIGATIAAGRCALSRPGAIPASRAVKDAAIAFCAAGVAASTAGRASVKKARKL